ncbi:cytochrome C1 family-domain-containing protein [Lipomyces oligophaga]|uniref:cytochrome C1 family-domain-containing protein n=1 Tax=Lipomyces oligophaga TaxID=45792 RepID=UPI0034CEB2F9
MANRLRYSALYKRLSASVSRGFSTSAQSTPEVSSTTRHAVIATLATGGLAAWYVHLYGSPINALTLAEHGLHPTEYPWPHSGALDAFDHQSLRRGFQVYQEVCAACHSLNLVAWRTLVGVTHTADEVRAMAEEVEYDSEPNDEGEIEKRPGKLADYIPAPYPNEQAARAANQGALPPDLSLIIKARHGGCDYVFSLLTGYPDEPPAGAVVASGLNYNPYFPGGGIAMGRVLFDGLVEYEDGTPATTTQMAKDVTSFLNWAAEPEHDDRKKAGMKAMLIIGSLWAISIWVKRFKWSPIKTRRIVYKPPKL